MICKWRKPGPCIDSTVIWVPCTHLGASESHSTKVTLAIYSISLLIPAQLRPNLFRRLMTSLHHFLFLGVRSQPILGVISQPISFLLRIWWHCWIFFPEGSGISPSKILSVISKWIHWSPPQMSSNPKLLRKEKSSLFKKSSP